MRNIMIVDDEYVIIAQLEESLTALGYTVVGYAFSGEDALEMARRLRPSLILMDIVMPGKFDGITAAKTIRAELNIPVVFITAHTDEKIIQRAAQVEPAGYIVKPFRENELRATLEVALHKAEMEQHLRESEEKYRNLFEHANDSIFIIEPSTHCFLEVNENAAKRLGYTQKELLQLTFIDIDTPMAVARRNSLIRELQETGSIIFEHAHRRKDGSKMPVEVSSRVIEYGGRQVFQSFVRDITERKQAEEALLHNRDRFRQVITSISDHIYVTTVAADGNKTNLYLSPNIEDLTGYPLEKFLNNWSFWAATMIHPDDKAIAARQSKKLAGGEASEVEYRLVRADNEVIWVRDSGRVVEENGSRIIYGVVGDVTRRKRANEEIRRRNRELTLLNQVIAASAESLETTAILKTVCRELALAFKVPQAAAALLNEQKTAMEVVAEYLTEGRPTALGNTIPVEDNPSVQYLLAHKAPLVVDDAQNDPRLIPVHDLMRQRGTVSLLILPLIIEGEVIGSLGLDAIEPRPFSSKEVNLAWRAADQVAGALARAQLTQTHQRLLTAIEQAAESVVITDITGATLYVNPAFEQTSGYSQAEAIGQNPRILKSGKQDSTFYQKMWNTLSAGEVWHGRFVNQKKNGDFYTEEATISPVREESGAIINYVAVKRDVTRELQLEEQYQQAQKMESIGRLAGGVAHDFNNLLTAIMGHAELTLLELHPVDPLRSDLEHIQKNAQRAASLTRQLLTFARRQIIEPKVLGLNELILNLDKMLRRLISENIELVTLLAPDLAQVKADPGQLEQVLVNLVVNAYDAMPNGGKLTIKTSNVRLDQNYARRHTEVIPGKYVMLAVSDNGFGMSEETKAQIFEPFFTTKEVGKGTGLGLATVFGIVKQSSGHIWVYSKPDQGTTFKIYLPHATEAIDVVRNRDQHHSLPQGTETILLVEDEASVRNLAARMLREQGYTVLEANNGEEAVHLAQKYSGEIHLLFTDVVMPQMGGKELADKFKKMYPNTTILFTSGYTDSVIAHHNVLDSGTAFLQKPFLSNVLARKVREVLDK